MWIKVVSMHFFAATVRRVVIRTERSSASKISHGRICSSEFEFSIRHWCLYFTGFISEFNQRYIFSTRRCVPRLRGASSDFVNFEDLLAQDAYRGRFVNLDDLPAQSLNLSKVHIEVGSSISKIYMLSLSEILTEIGLIMCIQGLVSECVRL